MALAFAALLATVKSKFLFLCNASDYCYEVVLFVLPFLDNQVFCNSKLNIAPCATAAMLSRTLRWWIMLCYHLTICPGSRLLWSLDISGSVPVATITFVQSNIRKAFLYFRCLFWSLAVGDLVGQQHVTSISAEAVFDTTYELIYFSLFLSFKIMFQWLQKFIFTVTFHLAVSNLRLDFFFPASVPLKAIL